ncbi:hypothetical protein X975_21713, partial [Stegodyphus mimosarum]
MGINIKNGIKVIANNTRSYRGIVRLLNKLNVEHHSYIVPEDKNLKVVLKGLLFSTEIEEIKSHLESLEYNVLDIKQMSRRRKGEVIKLPLYLATLRSMN